MCEQWCFETHYSWTWPHRNGWQKHTTNSPRNEYSPSWPIVVHPETSFIFAHNLVDTQSYWIYNGISVFQNQGIILRLSPPPPRTKIPHLPKLYLWSFCSKTKMSENIILTREKNPEIFRLCVVWQSALFSPWPPPASLINCIYPATAAKLPRCFSFFLETSGHKDA